MSIVINKKRIKRDEKSEKTIKIVNNSNDSDEDDDVEKRKQKESKKRKITLRSRTFDEIIENLVNLFLNLKIDTSNNNSNKGIKSNNSSGGRALLNKTFDELKIFFHFISERATIGGESIAYALNVDFVPIHSVEEICIYAEKKDFKKIFNYIVDFFGEDACTFIIGSFHAPDNIYSHHPLIINSFTLVSIKIDGVFYSLRLINTHGVDQGMDIVEQFDIDAIQCAIYNRKIYKTKICEEAQRSRVIRFINFRLKAERIHQMLCMNFKFKKVVIPTLSVMNEYYRYACQSRESILQMTIENGCKTFNFFPLSEFIDLENIKTQHICMSVYDFDDNTQFDNGK